MAATTPAPIKLIVVLGGSYAGVSTAHYTLKHAIPKLPEPESYRVVLVSRSGEAMCRQATPRAMIADSMFPQEKLFTSIPKGFESYPKNSFRFIKGTATSLDHTKRVVSFTVAETGTTETLEFHALVIATGASTPSPLLGFNKDEVALKDSWATFRESLKTAKSIVIAGGGPTGVEIAGELGEHLNGRAGLFKSKPHSPKVSITLVTSSSKLLPLLRPSIADKAEHLLAQVGVTVAKNSRVASVKPEDSGAETSLAGRTTVTLEGGKTLDADIYIPALGMTPNVSFVDISLLTADGSGRIETSKALRVDKAGPRIYAIGDAGSCARPAVHNILGCVPVLGANLKRDLLIASGQITEADAAPLREFQEDAREMQLVPIGQSKGVGAAMGWALPSWLVWLIKGRDYWLWTTPGVWGGGQWAKES
ncbi:hypothetical protein BX600DRAFT_487672 [Xylariales sp. PMI_506]|nr:hypothetical protein BX600DRAFT_487672 [Xylariales sp. PMI_506]